MTKKAIHKGLRFFFLTFWGVVLTWQFYNMQAHGVPDALLESDVNVAVTDSSGLLIFEPVVDTMTTALLFYPGALVDPEAYVPMAHAIAEAGHKTIIVKVPFRMAFLDRMEQRVFERTQEIMQQEAGRRWIVGGHSRGGAMAARFAGSHADQLAGLLLVGTSHPRRHDLSPLSIDVTKVYGSEDGLASEAEIEQFSPNLPDSTHFVRIDGGNHAQFAWYGTQLGGGSATISREAQQRQLLQAALEQLGRVD
ncbi:MAG TPA: alpha/beta family hydrolase [Rhodothermales bacterium]|nr:alpha/beta family hydrolase [Rhodothermales bacterium]